MNCVRCREDSERVTCRLKDAGRCSSLLFHEKVLLALSLLISDAVKAFFVNFSSFQHFYGAELFADAVKSLGSAATVLMSISGKMYEMLWMAMFLILFV